MVNFFKGAQSLTTNKNLYFFEHLVKVIFRQIWNGFRSVYSVTRDCSICRTTMSVSAMMSQHICRYDDPKIGAPVAFDVWIRAWNFGLYSTTSEDSFIKPHYLKNCHSRIWNFFGVLLKISSHVVGGGQRISVKKRQRFSILHHK